MPVPSSLVPLAGALAAIVGLLGSLRAQVSSRYTFAQSLATYVPITGGTLLGSALVPPLDDRVYQLTLPFPFVFDGVPQTQVQVSTNGFLTFGSTPVWQYENLPLSSASGYAGVVSAFGDDLAGGYQFRGDITSGSNRITGVSSRGPMRIGDFLDAPGIPSLATVVGISGDTITMSAPATQTLVNHGIDVVGPWAELRHQTLGTAPNRVFVVQWSGFRRSNLLASLTRDLTLNFQVRLDEGTGAIEIVYGDCSPGRSTTAWPCQVGLRGATSTFPADLSNRTNTKGVNDDWLQSAPGTANDSGMLFNSVAPANVIATGLTYRWSLPSVAFHAAYGAGCYRTYASFYQRFPSGAPAAFALAGNHLTMTRTADGFAVARGGATYVTPSTAATVLPLGDDTDIDTPLLNTPFPHAGGLATRLRVASNGFVSVAAGNGAAAVPDIAAFLAAPQSGWYAWHDFDPTAAGSGQVKFEQVGPIAYVTWDGVYDFAATSAAESSRLQFQFDCLTGAVSVVFGSQVSASWRPWLVGYSPGGPSLDPGSLDLANDLPLVTVPDASALTLSAGSRPVLGTTLTWTTSNIPAGALLSAQLVGLSVVNPGLPVPGAAGCLQLVNTTTAATVLLFTNPTASHSIALPNNAALVGRRLACQSASLVPGANLLGILTSNGVVSTFGTL